MTKKKSRNIILLISAMIASVAVFLHFGVIVIPLLMPYKFWLMLIAYGLILGAQ
ncbi:hypothetical protein PZB74_10380 [Porifericola rhodea]|uniref:hypothetical protein n=1 Tax=Porifericola rhodea TaxID=930972 RepID=UPI0026661505|nr:hypothetical protein [Porifericola rhodea]WKN33731.1 hypothetical protein PZB74_10380 [Porifericola rhodea]